MNTMIVQQVGEALNRDDPHLAQLAVDLYCVHDMLAVDNWSPRTRTLIVNDWTSVYKHLELTPCDALQQYIT